MGRCVLLSGFETGSSMSAMISKFFADSTPQTPKQVTDRVFSKMGAQMRFSAAVLLLAFVFTIGPPSAEATDKQVCDVAADFALGMEDFSTAIALHKKLLRSDKTDALAHYHLGYAYGMVGRIPEEIEEYLSAISLGLGKWDLFLNLGHAYVERHELAKAAVALETAVALGPQHSETHFDLAIVYEQQNRLREALEQIEASRNFAPNDPDAANVNAIVCAEMGHFGCAHRIWSSLVQNAPDYSVARTNLAALNKWNRAKSVQASFEFAGNTVRDERFSNDVGNSSRVAPNVLILEPVYEREQRRSRLSVAQ